MNEKINGHSHDHSTMTPEELREHNLVEMAAQIDILHLNNEMRIAMIANDQPWITLQFEMMSFKLDIVIDALSEILSVDKETQMAKYALHFQLLLSQHLDKLFPDTAPKELSETGA